MGKTKIEWADKTWSPVTGCTKVSPGCTNCYAERMSRRLSHLSKYAAAIGSDAKWSGVVTCHENLLEEPLHWRMPTFCFVCSMSDLFHKQVPWDFVGKVFDVMIACPEHTFLLLTKRPGRMAYWANVMAEICRERGLPWSWPTNVWAGTSVESQKYTPRLKCLERIPAKVRFVSCEPLLSSLSLACPYLDGCFGVTPLSWVITGGESGPGARPMNLDWVRSLRDQCQKAEVPFFFKQAGGRTSKAGGRILDGRTWDEMPEEANIVAIVSILGGAG